MISNITYSIPKYTNLNAGKMKYDNLIDDLTSFTNIYKG